jgi:hypothetical protein
MSSGWKFWIYSKEEAYWVASKLRQLGYVWRGEPRYEAGYHIYAYNEFGLWNDPVKIMLWEDGEKYFDRHPNIHVNIDEDCEITKAFVKEKIVTQEKRISVEQLVQNVVADNPGAKEVVEVRVASPIGLRPKALAEAARILEILEAMHRYVQAGKKVPYEWQDEISDLLANENYAQE